MEYHFTFTTLEEKDSTFLFRDQKKSQISLSVIRYPILTQLIESHVSNHNDIVYNNANKPLKFEDVPSLEKYHSIIFSKVNTQVSDHCIAFDKPMLALRCKLRHQFIPFVGGFERG